MLNWMRQRTSEIKTPKKLDLVGSPSNTRLYAAFSFETQQNELPSPSECFSHDKLGAPLHTISFKLNYYHSKLLALRHISSTDWGGECNAHLIS